MDLELLELAPGVTLEEVREKTGAPLEAQGRGRAR